MITQSGVLVLLTNSGCPTIEDVAVGLGRVPRFGGHTQRWWPVLLHSLVCLEIASRQNKGPEMQLYALWHDAHEAVTGDVPSTWKTPDIKAIQEELDRRMFKLIGLDSWLGPDVKHAIHPIDRAALLAEGWVLGPPGIADYYHLTEPPSHAPIVRHMAQRFSSSRSTNGPNSRAVKAFVRLTYALMDSRRDA